MTYRNTLYLQLALFSSGSLSLTREPFRLIMELRDGSSLIRKSVKSYPRKWLSFLRNELLKGTSRGTVTKSRRFSHLWGSVADVRMKLVRCEGSHSSWFFMAFLLVSTLFDVSKVIWPSISPTSHLRGDPSLSFHQKKWLQTKSTLLERPWKIMKTETLHTSTTVS